MTQTPGQPIQSRIRDLIPEPATAPARRSALEAARDATPLAQQTRQPLGRAPSGYPEYDELVFAPAHPRYGTTTDDPPHIGFELLQSADDANVPTPVAFSSLGLLVDALGEAQPWIAVRVGAYVEAMRDAGFDTVQLDPLVRGGTVSWGTAELQAYARQIQEAGLWPE